jgi:hypothetical protein
MGRIVALRHAPAQLAADEARLILEAHYSSPWRVVAAIMAHEVRDWMIDWRVRLHGLGWHAREEGRCWICEMEREP